MNASEYGIGDRGEMRIDISSPPGIYDNLTSLPSMTYFFELAAKGCRQMMQEGGEPLVLFLDLSGMKKYNHKYGYVKGDKLLREFAALLAGCFGAANCSRFIQDHFVVYTGEPFIEERLHELFEKWKEKEIIGLLPVRVGIYRFEDIDTDIITACDNAKVACDNIRNATVVVSGINFFNRQLQDDIDKKEYVISNIDKAIENGWIEVYYQPIIRAINGKVCDEEALARWIDPVRGFMSPADFIGILEDAHLIYKLDLYVVDCIIDKLSRIEKEGLHKVPQSVNLSRVDFDECDMVFEICRRVDEANISHRLLTIEITESAIASDFDYMKKQIERFRELGFQVWMDDFGSGYSSLDVLHDLEFDLIKFDMRFLNKLDEGLNGKIILTELMRMATTLGLETVCEGVETPEHVNFLKEIGCCKLQGYYYTKPLPIDRILERYRAGIQIGFENPEEAGYYDILGKMNLYDLEWVISGDRVDIDRFYNSIPMVIMELNSDSVRIVRSNASYREFAKRTFPRNVGEQFEKYTTIPKMHQESFLANMIQCAETGSRIFVDEKFPNNTTVHTFMRRIAINPVTGTKSVAVAVLSVTDDKNEK